MVRQNRCIIIRMSRKEEQILGALLVVGAGLWLASNPRCEHGCQTVAEHLIEHGIPALIKGLLA
jgi:hypothetical protein